ncbi:hypothetical protein PIB30_073959 [Stylosanthes scabra]|uniref:Uncharacterized protein n=1 Tax=Stylosanthes scabra TaxID=79078 RepID=A0ABU6QP41_9FABA|nr:hypothetical protein [Stylosanthes scabra]
MVRTRSTSMAKGKAKLCQPPTQASPRLAALRSNIAGEDTNLEQDEVVPVAEGGGREDLPKNDVYDALWTMLDAEFEAEEIPGEWDLDSVLQNWGRNEPDVGPAGPDQGPPPAEI